MATMEAPAAAREIREPAHGRRTEAIVLIALAAAVTILFAATPLDLVAARFFYRPGAIDPWPLARQLPWSVLYELAPWVTASLVLAGLAGVAAGALTKRDDWRRQAVFVLSTVVLGPGLVINTVFKDHWDRPRPREIVELGGPMHYVAAPLRGEGGASFPCGHCSVGYLYGLGWWVWRRRKPKLAAASLATGLVAGTLLGLGRMAAGGHFLSDVLWSALLAFGVAHLLYYYVLRVAERDSWIARLAGERAPLRSLQIAFVALPALGGVGVLLALFATPHGTPLSADIPLSSLPSVPKVLDVAARTASVDIVVVDAPADAIAISGELHGFGVPGSSLRAESRFEPLPVPTLYYRIEQRGWFTDLDGHAAIRVPAAGLERIVVRLEDGDIKVTDATRSDAVSSGRVSLDLHTAEGHVQVADAGPID
jgi:lipid A 4'-phosphatase